MQGIQDPNLSTLDNLCDIRREANRRFTKMKTEHRKAKSNELETNIKNKYIRDLYRDINDF